MKFAYTALLKSKLPPSCAMCLERNETSSERISFLVSALEVPILCIHRYSKPVLCIKTGFTYYNYYSGRRDFHSQASINSILFHTCVYQLNFF